jgi:hypothetical protein
LILYTIIAVPLQLGLNIQYGLAGDVIDYIVDAVFALDMIITFMTAYEDEGKMRRNYTDIAKNYFKTWFFPDLISTFPFDSIVQGSSDNTLRTIKLIRVLRLFRLLKLLRILRLNRKLKDAKVSDRIHPVLYQMAALFTYIFFVAHLLACAYYFVANCEHFPEDETAWTDCGHRDSSSSHYLASLYFVMTAIFGIGYGDVVIPTSRGRLFSIFVMFVGSITFGFVVATVSECVASWNPKITARKLKMDEMLAYCNEREFKSLLKISLLRHFDYFYNKTSIFSEKNILQSMPILLHQSVLEHSRENCLNHLNLFQKEEHSSLTFILTHLKPACLEPREAIVYEKDYLVDMHFIMRGTIHATVQNALTENQTVLVGIFGPGSDFGSSHALHCESFCWATYRATQLTDIMWLRYEVMQECNGRMKDLFTSRAEEEEKNQQEVSSHVHKSQEMGLLRLPAFIVCDSQVIPCRHAIRMLGSDESGDSSTSTRASAKVYKTVYMRGRDPDGRPNIVEDQETTIQMRLRYVINPNANYKVKFDVLVVLFALFSTITIPLRLGLQLPANLGWNVIDIVTEILFFVDMVLSFFTAYEQSDYSLNTIHLFIAKRYLRSWFLIDILSSIPFYRLSKAAQALQALVLCKALRIFRIFRLASVGKLFRFVNSQDNVSLNSEMVALQDGVNRIIYSIGFVALFTHLCACFWSWISLPGNGRTWSSELGIDDEQYLTKYIAAVYWSYTTLSTVGYGDIVAANDGERMYTILIFITGSTLLAYVVGLVRAYAFNRNGSKSAQEEKLNLVRHYLTEQGVSKSLKEIILKHFSHYLDRKTPFNEVEIWKNLPHHLRHLAIMAAYEKEFSQLAASFLTHFNEALLPMLMKHMEPAIAPRGSYIYTFETGCDGLYFVLDGIAEVIDEDENTEKEVIVAQMRKGMFFGHEKILGLSTDFLGVRALTPLKMLFIRTRNLDHLRQHLPLVYTSLIHAIQETLRPPPPTEHANDPRQNRAFGVEDQLKLVELLSNPARLTQQKRGYSRQQSSIEEAIEWFAEDMDELISTERGGLLTGEVYNPNCPVAILSANSKDQYKAMKMALKDVDRIDEHEKDDEEGDEEEGKSDGNETEDEEEGRDLLAKSEDEKRFHEEMANKMAKLKRSGKKHYAKIQINFHPRRPAVERKYRVRSIQPESSIVQSPFNTRDVNQGPFVNPFMDQGPLRASTSVSSPAPLVAEESFHFDPSPDSP